ncbi:MAG TPA: isocitrate lyase/phosphoenolpyruvate mutase family protein [Streptosporangiaceae bacterium]
MGDRTHADRALLFRSYHQRGVLVLPNAWDAASAAVIAAAGARAVATTSAGVSWALGRPDGHGLSRAEMAKGVERIAAAVTIPVTADIESAYGPSPDDAAATVRAVLAAGAVGINLEDSAGPGGPEPLLPVAAQAARIRAAREAAAAGGLPDLFVNARTDVYLLPEFSGDRLDEVRRRAEAYAAAGADGLFVPGLLDLAALELLAKATPLPINVMAVPGGPSVAEFQSSGARRISAGAGIAQAAYALARRAATELLTAGTYDSWRDGVGYGELNGMLSPGGR